MKYFSIEFPNYMNFIVKTPNHFEVETVVDQLSLSIGLLGLSGSAYNPKQFISVNSISSPDKRQEMGARNLEDILF